MLAHTTAWDRFWGGNETLKRVYVDRLYLIEYCNICSQAAPHLMDPRGLRVTQITYCSLLTHTKQLLLVTPCDMTAGIEDSFWTHEQTDR